MDLEKIVGYLPYGMKVKNGIGNIVELTAKDLYYHIKEEHRPILRPLSDLTKEIQIAEYYMSYLKHLERISDLDFDLDLDVYVGDGFFSYLKIDKYFTALNFLHAHHFDIHNLIEEGKAIDINTLEKHSR